MVCHSSGYTLYILTFFLLLKAKRSVYVRMGATVWVSRVCKCLSNFKVCAQFKVFVSAALCEACCSLQTAWWYQPPLRAELSWCEKSCLCKFNIDWWKRWMCVFGPEPCSDKR